MDASTRIVALSAAGAGAALVQYCSGCKASNIGAAGSLLTADQVTHAQWRQFDELGYDDLQFLRELDAEALRAVAQAAGMKPGHEARFVDYMRGVVRAP